MARERSVTVVEAGGPTRDVSARVADPDARNVADLLDGIPGARDRARVGLEQTKAGDTISLDEL